MHRHATIACRILALTVGLILTGACATLDTASETPEETVRRFCQLDIEGARLAGDTHVRVNPLVDWEQEPAPDPIYLITGYEVAEAKTTGDTAEVTVNYDIVGRVGVPWKSNEPAEAGLAGDLPAKTTVVYQLERRGSTWKITGPAVTPHTSPAVLASVIRSWPQSGANGDDTRLKDTLRYLEALPR